MTAFQKVTKNRPATRDEGLNIKWAATIDAFVVNNPWQIRKGWKKIRKRSGRKPTETDPVSCCPVSSGGEMFCARFQRASSTKAVHTVYLWRTDLA